MAYVRPVTTTSRPRPDLLGGFRALTFAPNPRLRQHRMELGSRQFTNEAWKNVARALQASIVSVGHSLELTRISLQRSFKR